MTIDSQHLPSTRAIVRAIQAVNEEQQEKARMRHLLTIAIALITLGAVLGIGANIAVTAAGDGHLDWIREWKVTAHWVGLSGVVMLAAYIVLACLRRRDERFARRIARLEEKCPGAQDAATTYLVMTSELPPDLQRDHVVDPKYLADMSEAVRLGEELERRKHQPPDQRPN